MTLCSLTIQTSTKSLTTRKTTNENTRKFGVPTAFDISVLHVSQDDFALQVESEESMQSGNRCYTEREGREDIAVSVAELMSQKSRRNSIGISSLQIHTKSFSEESQKILFSRVSEISMLMDEISRNIFDDALNIISGISKTTVLGRYSMDRSSSTRVFSRREKKDEGPSSSRKLCKKLPRN